MDKLLSKDLLGIRNLSFEEIKNNAESKMEKKKILFINIILGPPNLQFLLFPSLKGKIRF